MKKLIFEVMTRFESKIKKQDILYLEFEICDNSVGLFSLNVFGLKKEEIFNYFL